MSHDCNCEACESSQSPDKPGKPQACLGYAPANPHPLSMQQVFYCWPIKVITTVYGLKRITAKMCCCLNKVGSQGRKMPETSGEKGD